MVLYNQLASIINQSPLDIRVGCVHSTNRRRESLNLDFADVYKPLIVDRTALALINRRALQPYHFAYGEDGGMYLTAEGKRIFLDALYPRGKQCLWIAESPYLLVVQRPQPLDRTQSVRLFCALFAKHTRTVA